MTGWLLHTKYQWGRLLFIIASGLVYMCIYGQGTLVSVCAEPLIDTPLPTAPHHPTRLIIRTKPQSVAGISIVEELLPEAGLVRTVRNTPTISIIEIPSGDLDRALKKIQSSEEILYAEYDYEIKVQATPNDILFENLWGFENTGQTVNGDPGISGFDIQAVAAWEFWTGDPDFQIAVLDTGIDLFHPDLQANIWINENEVPNNGIDDDHNGWVDDYYGYNVIEGNGNVFDNHGHGTHVSGTIGAVGHNGIGVAGINWRCKIVPVKFLDSKGNGFISDAIIAIDYIIDQQIRISNNSWGCNDCFSQALFDVILEAQSVGHLFVASSGNGILGLGVDIDRFPYSPAGFDLPNIISVASMNNNNRKPKFSDFGAKSVDLAAPGTNILSTALGGGYEYRNGTSMSAAFVTGAAALLMSRRPDFSFEKIRDHILLSTEPNIQFEDITVSEGVLNLLGTIGDCNSNQILDEVDIKSGFSKDCNVNELPDECEPDCNGNDVADFCDISFSTSVDCDANQIPDECEPDCNQNGRVDACDISDSIVNDCNYNSIPDLCETRSNIDCNNNDIPDICDLFTGVSSDCNENGIPDVCDINNEFSEDCTGNQLPDECERDCNSNGFADSCDIVFGTSLDKNMDHVPDECQLGMLLIPIGATTPYVIEDSTISIVQGAHTITFEIIFSGWDPDQDGAPRLQAYQCGLEVDDFHSGETGSLSLTRIPCVDNDDCLADSLCEETGYCDLAGGFGINEFHPNFVFAGVPTITLSDPSRLRVGALIFLEEDAKVDTGIPKYGGLVTLDISADATGIFTIGFKEIESFFSDGSIEGNSIPTPGLIPAKIIISPDCNINKIPDELDISEGTSGDCDLDGVPDECVEFARDCNGNLIPDVCDIDQGTSPDCNINGIPDECISLESDCNNNGIPDLCDTNSGQFNDCNGNGIPDECISLELDCNANNHPDACDIVEGLSHDCNHNNIPDTCDNDCNENGFADECDIETGVSRDRDHNDIPDECQRFLLVPEQFPTIQDAVDHALNGDVVLISNGVYSGDGNVDIAFNGKSVMVRGENGPENCIIDATGYQTAFFIQHFETRNAHIEGLTIMNALYTGIACIHSNPTISNCIIKNNGPGSSGILCLNGANPLIENCLIKENRAQYDGGGIRITGQSSPTIINCTITNNSADEFGGGVFVSGGSPTILHSSIIHNHSVNGGGGIYLINSQATFSNCTISGNLTGDISMPSSGSGGGVYLENMFSKFSGCIITGNKALNHGGGVYATKGDPVFTNCTIAHNLASNFGGGVFWFGGSDDQIACCNGTDCLDALSAEECAGLAGTVYPRLTCGEVECATRSCCLPNDTCENLDFFACLSANGSPQFVGSQCANLDCSPSFSNSIIWENFSDSGPQFYTGTTILNMTNSTILGGWDGDDNNTFNPDFVEPGYRDENDVWVMGDYHVNTLSAVINSGRNDRISPEFIDDRDGHPRILCEQIDRGAYEFGIGDYNCDFNVDLIDFQQWIACINGVNGKPYPDGCHAFDFNTDNRIDMLDYAQFQQHIGHALP